MIADNNFYHIKQSYNIYSTLETDDIAESFGISGSYIRNIVNMYIPDDFDILYITGDSGCGKTTILSILKDKVDIYYDSNFDINENESILNILRFDVGIDEKESIGRMTSVGLSDITTWLTPYKYLSDSEKARFEVAYRFIKNDFVIMDEFLSTLDRRTAKAVSFSIQKFVRKNNKKLVIATAHDDLVEYICPSYILYGKSYPSRFKLIKKDNSSFKNIILDSCRFEYGNNFDYNKCQLAELHYRGKYTGGAKEYLFCFYGDEIVGLLVSIYNMHTGGRRIARLVVHPTFRGVGIGTELVKRYLEDYKDTDVIASMGLYVPVFESAGMTRLDDVIINPPVGLKNDLSKFSFDFSRWYDKDYLYTFCSDSNVREIISHYSKHASSYVCPGGVYLSDKQIKNKLMQETNTCSRVLYNFRERRMAKYCYGKG